MIVKDIKVKIIGTFLLVLIITIWSMLPKGDHKVQFQSNKCRWSNNMKSEAFDGVVIKKFDDAKNHYMPTLLIDQGKTSVKMVLQNEISGFYDYVTVGDTIRKRFNTLLVEIIRNNENVNMVLDYGCQEK